MSDKALRLRKEFEIKSIVSLHDFRAFDSFKVTHISERRYTPSFFCQFLNLYLHVTYRYCILEGEKYHS